MVKVAVPKTIKYKIKKVKYLYFVNKGQLLVKGREGLNNTTLQKV